MDYVGNIKCKVKQSRRNRLDEFKHKFRNNKIIIRRRKEEERSIIVKNCAIGSRLPWKTDKVH